MAQGKKAKSAKKGQSLGSARKHVGHTAKNLRKKFHDLRDKAGKSFIKAIEADMATRLPSDQRSKLTVLKATGPRAVSNRKMKGKKPLTRGRTRKGK